MNNKKVYPRFKFAIDRGGTFTDIYCEIFNEENQCIKKRISKLLSEDNDNYHDAPTEGIRRILEQELQTPFPRNLKVNTSHIESIRMGTTVATNALLERKGERCCLVTTKGFKDLQRIGNQSRPKIFDLNIQRPELLYDIVVEVDERVCLYQEYDENMNKKDFELAIGKSKDTLVVEKQLDIDNIYQTLKVVYDSGIRSLAVVLLHSYSFDKHEIEIKRIAQNIGYLQISLSSEVMPMIRMVPRGATACVDAYLTPVLQRYLRSFASGFDDSFNHVVVNFMQSDGGLTPMSKFYGSKSILSGPAGGVVGYANTSFIDGIEKLDSPPLVGFDMGGTSTDVSRCMNREFEHVFETSTAGVTIQSPQLDINTVAAGGGSRLFYRNGLFVCGPESCGSTPGPACYGKGGPLAITDANLLLGRIQPHLFPKIFGKSEREPLDLAAAKCLFDALTIEVNKNTVEKYSVDEIAHGFIQVANEAMSRPIRNLTTMKGYDVTKHVLACFGGAGPQHCCAIAKILNMQRIFIHKYSGILSAFGLSLADVVVEKQQPFSSKTIEESFDIVCLQLLELQKSAVEELVQQSFGVENIDIYSYLNCRYSGTDTSIMVLIDNDCDSNDINTRFVANYKREYGFDLVNRSILVDDLRIRAVGKNTHVLQDIASEIESIDCIPVEPKEFVSVYFAGGRQDTPVFYHEQLICGVKMFGPAMIIQNTTTVVVEPGCSVKKTKSEDLLIEIDDIKLPIVTIRLDPIYLSIFSHRFMGIAEQMGRTLQRTSISVNIKERLDFSCAVFDKVGRLVANAPHLPVHLGSMSSAVTFQITYWGDDLQEGDVLVSNHPQLAGGSHLPDITVITPIFVKGILNFFVASRGHHADIGGITSGSMPSFSKCLEEEGAAIIAFKLVRQGVFQEEGITSLLNAPGELPSNFGARNIRDNLSDLKAQVAANFKGSQLLLELVEEYSLDVVQAYMYHIQVCAENAVRDYLRNFSVAEDLQEVDSVSAVDYLDDGSPIALKITINRISGSAIFDFTGTGPEIYGNCNAPPSVVSSAIIYCMRCLLKDIVDIPLNQGCLEPIEIIIPNSCLLNPSANAAVVGGNVLTSQRITDVILLAFKACAASQGCMNNFTFGDSTMGYYETICGGSGAGPSWNGTDGVHTHMTNTRITDPEIFEKRYPVILRQFSIRKGSGGEGMYKGGDGVIREVEFRKKLTSSILTERRVLCPYGLQGGVAGDRGVNLLIRKDSKYPINIGGKNTIQVSPGDRLVIKTPGGGGYGVKDQNFQKGNINHSVLRLEKTSGSLHQYTLNQEST